MGVCDNLQLFKMSVFCNSLYFFLYIFFFFRQRVSGKLGKVLSELVSAQKKCNRDAEEDEWRLFCPKVNSETVLAL